MSTYKTGDYVDGEFADECSAQSEWMCVRVHHCDDETRLVFGTLDSVPLNEYGKKLKSGTELTLSFAQIHEHKTPWEFESKS